MCAQINDEGNIFPMEKVPMRHLCSRARDAIQKRAAISYSGIPWDIGQSKSALFLHYGYTIKSDSACSRIPSGGSFMFSSCLIKIISNLVEIYTVLLYIQIYSNKYN